MSFRSDLAGLGCPCSLHRSLLLLRLRRRSPAGASTKLSRTSASSIPARVNGPGFCSQANFISFLPLLLTFNKGWIVLRAENDTFSDKRVTPSVETEFLKQCVKNVQGFWVQSAFKCCMHDVETFGMLSPQANKWSCLTLNIIPGFVQPVLCSLGSVKGVAQTPYLPNLSVWPSRSRANQRTERNIRRPRGNIFSPSLLLPLVAPIVV